MPDSINRILTVLFGNSREQVVPLDRSISGAFRSCASLHREERQVLVAVEADGKAPSEWVRDLLLRGAVAINRGEMEIGVGIPFFVCDPIEEFLSRFHLSETA